MQKKIPMRQCVGCREMRPKRELVRVVKSPEGEITLDGKPVRRAKIRSFSPQAQAESGTAPPSLDDLCRLQPDDIFRKLHRSRFGGEPTAELLAVFGELVREADTETAP